MTVSVPLIVVIGGVVYVAYRYLGLRAWHALVCLVLGFLLAATSVAPELNSVLSGLVQWLQKP